LALVHLAEVDMYFWRPVVAITLPLLAVYGCSEWEVATAPGAEASLDISTQSVTHVVTTKEDDGSSGSLRNLIETAANGHNITFAPELAGETIELADPALAITRSLTIVGPPEGVTIVGGGSSRVFIVATDVYDVVIENLTIRGGSVPGGHGGGLFNGGRLTLRNSTLEENWAQGDGGAIFNTGWLTLENSTVARNGVHPVELATSSGGGILNFQGRVDIVNSTISGNTARIRGGGIYNVQGEVSVVHGTIANNGASSGGGITVAGTSGNPSQVDLVNSILAGNFASTAASGPDLFDANPDWATIGADHSLIGTVTGYELATDGGSLIGADPLFELDALGKPHLADNGGPTLTHRVLAGSPAIDQADRSICEAAPVNGRDQRGVLRPQGAECDMGSFEAGQVVVVPPVEVTDIGIHSAPTVDKGTGVAYLTGTLVCPSPGLVDLIVTLLQEQKQKRLSVLVGGSSTVSVSCNGPTSWAAAVSGENGVFVNGQADAVAITANVTPALEATETVRLFWSR
jgi:hypothetical protein